MARSTRVLIALATWLILSLPVIDTAWRFALQVIEHDRIRETYGI